MPNNPTFLDLDDVLEIHRRQLNLFGGGTGIRDIKLLESAVAQPTDDLFRLTMDVANDTRNKAAVAEELRRLGGAPD